MSLDILSVLKDKPQEIFKFFKKENEENSDYFNKLIKDFLDPISKKYSVLDEIYIDGLDSTQVFGQTKMVLEGVGEGLLFNKIPELKEKYGSGSRDEEVDSELEEGDEDGEEQLGDESEEEMDEEQSEHSEEEQLEEDQLDEEESDSRTLKDDFNGFSGDELSESETRAESDNDKEEEEIREPKKDAFGLNDVFFDIDEFNKQTLALEEGNNQQDNEEEEEIDFFGDISDEDEDDEQMTYFDDFYEKPGKVQNQSPKKQQKQETEEDEIEEFDENDYKRAVGSAMLDLFAEEDKPKDSKHLSSFEKQQQKIQDEIAKLEAELVADKKWTMKGEITSKDRPQDSLLDDPETASLEFDRTAKPVPVITQEVTETLEDLIRRRIKNDEFDDLPKRIVTDISKFHNKQKFELSEEKSTKSLADMYEDEYRQVDYQQEMNEELKKQHDEISDLFTKITHKLDSLCSAHFIPKPHQFKTFDIKVNDNAASINMEDAQPLHVSSETTLAPQEIYKIGDEKSSVDSSKGNSEVLLKSGLSYSKAELSREDKQRLRRANKRKRAKEFNQRKELQEQRQKQSPSNNKRQKVGEVIDTLSKAKNITVIGKKGELRDVKGNIKKSHGPQGSSSFKL